MDDPTSKSQVQVRFFSTAVDRNGEPALLLPDVPILVPTVLGRAGLAQIVHHFLAPSSSSNGGDDEDGNNANDDAEIAMKKGLFLIIAIH